LESIEEKLMDIEKEVEELRRRVVLTRLKYLPLKTQKEHKELNR
jgi:hypothetical protein